jgi:hypothetical protein
MGLASKGGRWLCKYVNEEIQNRILACCLAHLASHLNVVSTNKGIRQDLKSGPASDGNALDDVKIGDMQLCLENVAQDNGIVAVKGNDRVALAVALRGAQDGLRVSKYRVAELEDIRKRKEIRYLGMADACKIEHKGVAGSNAAQGLVRRSRDDCAAWRRAGTMHDYEIHGWPGIIHGLA